jgi:type II secretory ATPase GspE/PulE/Tfp pilus assembly ATPase PilB-like protein/CheY-like chemotaxis protein
MLHPPKPERVPGDTKRLNLIGFDAAYKARFFRTMPSPPRPGARVSAPNTPPKLPRDAWLLAALEREKLLSTDVAEQFRRHAPEWAASEVIQKGWVAADVVVEVAARVAHVPVANLARIEPPALHFVPEGVARQYAALPLSATNRVIRIATADPLNLDAEQALSFVAGRQVEFQYALPALVLQRVAEVYRPERPIERLVDGLGTARTVGVEGDAAAPTPASGIEAPAARLVDAAIADAVRERASDVHIEPSEQGLVIRYRIDGVLKEVMRVPQSAAGSVVRRLKVIANLNIADPLHPHEGRAAARVDGKAWDLRVSTAPVGRGVERVLLRLRDPSARLTSVGELGLWPDELAALEGLVASRDGAVLVVGPSDSGTTTTAYAAFLRAHSRAGNAATVEAPIEFRLQDVNQIEVSEKGKFTFAEGLRSVLRQNPEVILVGEIGDAETAEAAWQAARSGRLIFSILRTRDVASTISRLRELGLDDRVNASSLRGVVAQRLMRRLCDRCAEPVDASSLPPPSRPPGQLDRPIAMRKAKGCPECGFTGYRGRAAIHETLAIDASIAGSLASGASVDALVRAGQRYGMRTLWQAGLRRVWAGETSYDELTRVVDEPAVEVEVSPSRAAVAPPTPAEVPARVRAPSQPAPPTAPGPSPAHAPAAAGVPASASTSAGPTGMTAEGPPEKAPLVLIADDDPAMRVLVITIMKAQGFEVAEAVDGLDALDQAQRLAPAIVLLDIDMPRLDGFGVLEALRRRLAGRAVPVVVVTVHDDPATEARCIELGAEDYLTKPIQPSSLVVRVRAVLRRAGVNYAWPRS